MKNILTWIHMYSFAYEDLEFLLNVYYKLFTINAADQTK